MNRFLNWLVSPAKKTARLEQKAAGGLIAFHAGGAPVWSAIETTGLDKGFGRNPVVYRCVRMISEAASTIPFKVCEGRIDCDEHPVLDLVNKPNEHQSATAFLETLYGHLLVTGNAYVTRIDIDDVAQALHALDPRKVTPVLDKSGWPVAYDYQSGGTKTRYDAETGNTILHLALFNPLDEITGQSPLAAAHMALDIHNAASAWNKALLDNSARPSGALVYASSGGENLSEDQFNRLKQELEEGYAGASRAGRPMVLEGGLDWKAMGYSPRDMDFLQAKNGAAREIALAFGVPPMLLGIPGDNTYSNYQEANRAFWIQTVLPLAEKTAQDLGNWLSAPYDFKFSLRADKDHLPALATEREAHWRRIGDANFLTANEKREAFGFPPLQEELFPHD